MDAQLTQLTSSAKNRVSRAVPVTGESIIVKESLSVGPRNVREQAALQVLGDLGVAGAPRLLGSSDDPPTLLLEDIGTGPSLSDRLLGSDREAAAAAVTRWATAIGSLQAATLDAGRRFSDALTALAPADPPPLDSTGAHAVDTTEILAGLLPQLGVPTAGLDELVAVADLSEGPHALTPGDACPDNNLERDGRQILIDFEWAEYRHVAWDAAYLTVPWPTCWCSWRLPSAVTASATAAWRAALTPALDAEQAAGLDVAVERATVAWALMTTAWQLPRAMGEDHLKPNNPGRLWPDRRAIVQHRLAIAARSTSRLGLLASAALAATQERWGVIELPLGPAWR
jgi:hypothetical protein